MYRRLPLPGVLVVALSLGFAACGHGAATSSDAEPPLPTVDASVTSAPRSTPLPVTPQSTPSPSDITPTALPLDVPPSPAPASLADCIGHAAAPNQVDVAGQAPPQVLAGYPRGIYAVDADGSDIRYAADVHPWAPAAEFSGNFAWSPDGTKIAFMGSHGGAGGLVVLDPATGEMDDFSVPLYVWGIEWSRQDSILAWGELIGQPKYALDQVPLDGSTPAQLFFLPSSPYDLAWSPNGRCFAIGFAANSETHILAEDGSLLTGVKGGDRPVWSPDGSTLALECGDGGPWKTCVWPLDGSEAPREIGIGIPEGWSDNGDAVIVGTWNENAQTTLLLSPTGEAAPVAVQGESATISHDGAHLAFVRDGNIYVKNLTTGDEVQVTDSIIPYMGQPIWSPDGSTLLFTFNPRDTDIYIANADGSDERPLMSGHAASWSPDGSRIEFAVGEAALGSWGSLYVAGSDHSLVRLGNYAFGDVVTSLCWGHTNDPWSPDGKYIVYETESDPNTTGGVYLANPDGSTLPLRTHYGSGPNWSPDGEKVTFTGAQPAPSYACTVFTATVPDGAPVPLAEGLRSTWSPRGDLIAFTNNSEIHVIGPDGTGERTVASAMSAGTPHDLLWSPDGHLLASSFVTSSNQWSTYVVNVDNPAQPTYVSEGEVESWTPDGQKLVVSRFEDRHYVSYLVNLDGSGEQKFVDGAGVDWSPDGTKILYSR